MTHDRRIYLNARRTVERTAREFGAWVAAGRCGTTGDKRTTMLLVAVRWPGVLPDPAEVPEPLVDCLGERLSGEGVEYRKIDAADFIPPSLRAKDDGLRFALIRALNTPLRKSKVLGSYKIGRLHVRDMYVFAEHRRMEGEDYAACRRRVLNLSWAWGVRVTLPAPLSSRRSSP